MCFQEQGLVVVGEGRHEAVDGREAEDDDLMRPKIALVSPEAAEVLQSAGEGSLGKLISSKFWN